METRERVIRLWFDMWLKKTDLGILEIFSQDALYIESWNTAARKPSGTGSRSGTPGGPSSNGTSINFSTRGTKPSFSGISATA